VKLDGITLRLAPVEATAAYLWGMRGAEIHQLRLLLRFLVPGQAFIDVGSNAGLFAIAIAKKIGQEKVYAFETSEERFQLLQRHLDMNAATHLLAMRSAFGDRVGETTLPDESWNFDEVYWAPKPNAHPAQQETVPVTTLDSFVETRAIPRLDAMRLNARGAELNALQGGSKLLERPDAPLVLCELSVRKTSQLGYHPVEPLWFLIDCGYTLFVMDPKTGRLQARQPNGQYNALIVAAKSIHMPRLKSLCHSL